MGSPLHPFLCWGWRDRPSRRGRWRCMRGHERRRGLKDIGGTPASTCRRPAAGARVALSFWRDGVEQRHRLASNRGGPCPRARLALQVPPPFAVAFVAAQRPRRQ